MKRLSHVLLLALMTFILMMAPMAKASTIQTAYKIGIAHFANSSEFSNASQFIVDTFYTELPKSLNVKTWRLKEDIIFSNKDSVIHAGRSNGADTILTGSIQEYTVKKDVWLGGVYAKVRVEAQLYSTVTGDLIWNGTVTERYRGDTEIHCLQKATRETVWALKKAMIAAGLQGRPSDIDKPTVELEDSYLSKTSVFFLEGAVKDNFGVSRLTINSQPVKFGSQGNFSFMVPLTSNSQDIQIRVEDEAGNITDKKVEIHRIERLQGSVAQVAGNKVFINLGANNNLREGAGFTVSSVQAVKDPATGQVLDSISMDVAIIKVIEVKEKVSIAEVVNSLNGGKINIGDTIY